MSYCLNPNCSNPADPINSQGIICRNCGSKLLLQDRYRIIKNLGKGGFCQTFEIDDQGTLKALKVLNSARFSDPKSKQKVVSLFQQEADVLSQLHHSGIPQVESDAYLVFWPQNSQEPLHCIVMEKIEGENLQEWLENRGNQSITLPQAIAWLKQLAEILNQLHQKNYLHRDIKPANIMLRPNGQLVLIDFGAVKEFTQTYLQQQNVTGTVIGTPGYSPPEQVQGRALPQSDFFALGRVFAHLLTGKHPLDLSENPKTGKLIWRNSMPNRSNSWVDFLYKLLGRSLADFIDELMDPSWQKRPKNTRVILKRLKKILRAPIIELASVFAILLVLLTSFIYWYLTGVNGCSKIWLRSFTTGDNLSCGEEVIIPYSLLPETKKGVDSFKADNYQDSVSWLEKAWQKQRNPETLIYLNNARLAAEKAKAYTIAVVAPLNDNSLDTGQEILRGVAQAQDEFNKGRKPGQIGLKVLIANDENKPVKVHNLAESLASKNDVLAVVGHYTSEVTLAALPIYEKHDLVVVSGTSTSKDLSNKSPFFFRITPSDRDAAQHLAFYLTSKLKQQKAAVFYNPNSNYSNSMQAEFRKSFSTSQVKVVKDFDLSQPFFIAREAIDQAQTEGATVLVLIPDGQTNAFAFNNTLKVINASNSSFFMVGASALYSPEVLQTLRPELVSRFTQQVAWHNLSSPNSMFPPAANKLWGGDVSWRTALVYDAAITLITALQSLPQANRIDVKNALADPKFQAFGATGVISFGTDRDRKEAVVELVKVVPSKCSPYGARFVPLNYPKDKLESLERCQEKK